MCHRCLKTRSRAVFKCPKGHHNPVCAQQCSVRGCGCVHVYVCVLKHMCGCASLLTGMRACAITSTQRCSICLSLSALPRSAIGQQKCWPPLTVCRLLKMCNFMVRS